MASIPFSPATNAAAILDIVLRWIHFVAGITWIGLLYFFNLVSTPLLQEVSAPTRVAVIPPLMSRAMWWFRWSAVVTVLAGIAYWMRIGGTDARNGSASPGFLFMTFFVVWVLAFIFQMGLFMAGMKTAVVAIAETILIAAAALIFLGLNNHGWESNRTLCIGVGGGIGLVMLLNVWGLVWRANKKIIRWAEGAGARGEAMPPELASFAAKAQVAARVNFGLSFPLLFFMAAASHFPLFGR
ncbi:MAG TPA: hypothetical protein VE998_02075 [Terriglobales bacterium]|nr:hypothetical protein [Terriglobales bacterium]